MLLLLSAILAALTGAIGPSRAATVVQASASATSPTDTARTIDADSAPVAGRMIFDRAAATSSASGWVLGAPIALWTLRRRE